MKHFSLLLSLCALAGAAHANPGLSAKLYEVGVRYYSIGIV